VVKPRDPQETLCIPLLVLSQLVTAPSAPASRAAGCRAATLCPGRYWPKSSTARRSVSGDRDAGEDHTHLGRRASDDLSVRCQWSSRRQRSIITATIMGSARWWLSLRFDTAGPIRRFEHGRYRGAGVDLADSLVCDRPKCAAPQL